MDEAHDRAILRRHAADGTLMAGGAAAILLQLADPRVAAGVARHSAFRERPLDRLDGTHQYLTALVFGDDRDIDHVVRVVDARHARVRGDRPRPYDARDADAQRWVAATILAVALELEERLTGRPLDAATADALVRGYAPIAARLQGRMPGGRRRVASSMRGGPSGCRGWRWVTTRERWRATCSPGPDCRLRCGRSCRRCAC